MTRLVYNGSCILFSFDSELIDGVAVYDENNNKISESRYAAVKGISQVTFSRILMATPGMSESSLFQYIIRQFPLLTMSLRSTRSKSIEPRREKSNVLVSDMVRHRPGCTATRAG